MTLTPNPWLSGILGKPTYHLSGSDFTVPEGRAFVDAKVAVDDSAALSRLQAFGFALMDTNVQFVKPAGAMPQSNAPVRMAAEKDETGVRALASEAFIYDRFHRDPAIGHSAASRLKAEWAGNYFSGKRGDRMIVAEDDAGIAGFLQLLRGQDGATIIDLVAVAERSRGKGLARAMIGLAANTSGAGDMRVGTQAANLPSIALYQSLGFRKTSASHVLHLHTGEQP